jgi:hypothetical protein
MRDRLHPAGVPWLVVIEESMHAGAGAEAV